jgi:hypothetical protein
METDIVSKTKRGRGNVEAGEFDSQPVLRTCG